VPVRLLLAVPVSDEEAVPVSGGTRACPSTKDEGGVPVLDCCLPVPVSDDEAVPVSEDEGRVPSTKTRGVPVKLLLARFQVSEDEGPCRSSLLARSTSLSDERGGCQVSEDEGACPVCDDEVVPRGGLAAPPCQLC